MRRVFVVLFLVVVFGPILASQPGQPLDCSDFEPAIGGITCSEQEPMPCVDGEYRPLIQCRLGNTAVVDNEGYTYALRQLAPYRIDCPGDGGNLLSDAEVFRFRAGVVETVGWFRARCGTPGNVDAINWIPECADTSEGRLLFDSAAGALLIPVFSRCDHQGNSTPCAYGTNYGTNCRGVFHRVALGGFAPLSSIIESYSPTAPSLSFHIPLVPEGLSAADSFDTYWGQVTRPLDLSQARPLQCAYPDHQPQVGEYLVVISKCFPESGWKVEEQFAVSGRSGSRAGSAPG